MGFTACNARLIDGTGTLIAGTVYWFGKDRALADRGQAFAQIEAALAPLHPRPHWGKLFLARADAIAPRYERHADFVALGDGGHSR